MKELEKCIEALESQLERHRHSSLKEYPTRTIFIDPLLGALGWDVRDPDAVELEHATIDGKSVDYALKLHKKSALFVEAKQLNDPLTDVKDITQTVGYASNNGVEWCVLTNGIHYKVYKSSEPTPAPEKLLFEVSLDPLDNGGLSIDQIASRLSRLSKNSLESGLLDHLGEEIFTTAKVRKALDTLFTDPPAALLRAVRKAINDTTLTPKQIRQVLPRIWQGQPAQEPSLNHAPPATQKKGSRRKGGESVDYGESHHTREKPKEVVELYRALDRLCQDMAPGHVVRRFLAKYVSWSLGKRAFCSAHLQQGGLRVWVKVDPKEIGGAPASVRDVSAVGHWGTGNVEIAVNGTEGLQTAALFIQKSFESAQTQTDRQ
jgi:predicted transport protein